MQIHLRPRHLWQQKCEAIAEALGVDLEKHEARIYDSVERAVAEASIGLRRLYSLKKKIFFQKHGSPHFEAPLQALAKEGLALEPLTQDLAVDRDSHFALYAVDDPVLGTYEDFASFEKAVADTQLLRVRVSYHQHHYKGLPQVERNLVHILGCPDGRALVLLGERVRYAPSGVELLDWSGFEVKAFVESLGPKYVRTENKSLVQNFECRTDLGFAPLLPFDASRVYDRALVYWEDLDSSAMEQSLRCRLGEFDGVSLSLSRWGSPKMFAWLHGKGYTPGMLRGALIIDVKDLEKDLVPDILQARREILEAQSGVK